MKTIFFILFLVFVIFLNSSGAQQPELPPIRTFQYRPAIHMHMAYLLRKVNGEVFGFNVITTLVARGATLIGWLNDHNIIEPIFVRNALVTYNLDEQVASVTNKAQLELYGVYRTLPVGPWNLDPIRTFKYKQALHMYLAFLRRKVDGQEVRFDENTILVARGADLFGWLNTEDVIEPIFIHKKPAMYNLDEQMPTRTNVPQLMTYGLYDKLIFAHSDRAQASQSSSGSRSRNPRN